MKYVGIDLHKQSITACVVDQDRNLLQSRRVACADTARIDAFFAALGPFEAAVEATASYEWLLQRLEPRARRVVLAHPGKLRIIAESTRKSDKLDARVLAEFLALDRIPPAYRPAPRQREHRALVRHRQFLQRRRTGLRVEILTRLRPDARLHALPPARRRKGQRGPAPKWGKELSPPRQGGRWPGAWHRGEAFLYGRMRKARGKEVVCLWRVLGHDVTVKAVVAEVEGYKKRFTPVSSAVGLTGLEVVELFAARFRQEDGSRDLKQRLGWEECRAWTRDPIERTSQVQWVTRSLMRLLQFGLDAEGCPDRWSPPPWNKRKDRPSVLDVERLLRRHREEIRRLLSEWLGDEEEAA